jgi:hypothetical protein
VVGQLAGQLAPTPTVARFHPQAQHFLRSRLWRARRTPMRATRTIWQTIAPGRAVTAQPFVAGLRRDPESPAQRRLTSVCIASCTNSSRNDTQVTSSHGIPHLLIWR